MISGPGGSPFRLPTMQVPVRNHHLKHCGSHPRWVAKRSNPQLGRKEPQNERHLNSPCFLGPDVGKVAPAHHSHSALSWSPPPRPSFPCSVHLATAMLALLFLNTPNSFPCRTTAAVSRLQHFPQMVPRFILPLHSGLSSKVTPSEMPSLTTLAKGAPPISLYYNVQVHCPLHGHHYRIFLLLHQFIGYLAAQSPRTP